MSSKPVAETDLEELWVVAEVALRVSVMLPSDVLEDLLEHTRKNIVGYISRPDCVFLKYEENAEIIGFILIKEYWNLSDLFVLPEHQSKGVGSALLLEALAICRLQSTRQSVRLNSSINAVRFYSRHGFSEVDKPSANFEYSAPMEISL